MRLLVCLALSACNQPQTAPVVTARPVESRTPAVAPLTSHAVRPAANAPSAVRPAANAPSAAPAATPSVTAEAATQIEQGKQLYVASCAACHGERGGGTEDGPALFTTTALPLSAPSGSKREVAFGTAGDVLAWVASAMPADDPGSLGADQYLAIVAYVIRARGATLARPLDAASAQTFALRP